MASDTRQQRLLTLADGLFAALAAVGVTELLLAAEEFDYRLARAWRVWVPASRAEFPTFEPGVHDFREVLFRLMGSRLPSKRTWPALEQRPAGMDPEDYLRERCPAATPAEWLALARAFMDSA